MIELRSDRLATLYLFHPLQKLLRAQQIGAGTIPILMYHGVRDDREAGRHPYYRTTTRPSVFEEQMRFLAANGYEAITPDVAARRLTHPAPGAAKPVAITFDDGLRDFYTDALPVLRRYNFSATVYLPTAFIASISRRFRNTACMTWAEVRECHQMGIQFGSHTVTHPQLKNLPEDQILHELCASKATLEDELGESVTSFSYPFAFPDADPGFRSRLRAMLEASGYDNGVSTTIGTTRSAADRYFMQRLPVNSCDDPRLFQAKLEGGYNWLRSLQYASKFVS